MWALTDALLECGWRLARREDWRRERDSNPRRAFDPYTLSRGGPSTTRPSLRTCDARLSVPLREFNGDDGPAAKAGKNTGGNPEGKGLSGLEGLEVRRAAEVGYWATAAARPPARKIIKDPGHAA